VPLFLKRLCDRTLGDEHNATASARSCNATRAKFCTNACVAAALAAGDTAMLTENNNGNGSKSSV
jgi:hypothetical protein